MPLWLQITITAVLIPGAGFGIKVLYEVGAVMGKIDAKLDGHDDRIGRLEDAVYSPPAPRRTRTARP